MLIETTFLPCTETRPDRVKATCDGESITLCWNNPKLNQYSVTNSDTFNKHVSAAMELANSVGLKSYNYAYHETKTGYVFVALIGGESDAIRI